MSSDRFRELLQTFTPDVYPYVHAGLRDVRTHPVVQSAKAGLTPTKVKAAAKLIWALGSCANPEEFDDIAQDYAVIDEYPFVRVDLGSLVMGFCAYPFDQTRLCLLATHPVGLIFRSTLTPPHVHRMRRNLLSVRYLEILDRIA